VLDALKILKPETALRWHRAGFRAYWRWKPRLEISRFSATDAARDERQQAGRDHE
jgi:hypothetical protein